MTLKDVPIGRGSNDLRFGLAEKRRMHEAIDVLVRHDRHVNTLTQVRETVHRDLNEVYGELDGFRPRREAGDWLAETDSVEVIARYMEFLIGLPRTGQIENVLISLYNVLLKFSQESRHFAREVGREGILHIVVAELEKLRENFIQKEEMFSLVHGLVNILHNCSKVQSNQRIYSNLGILDVLVPFTSPETANEKTGLVAMASVMTLSYTCTKEELNNRASFANPSIVKLMLQLCELALENTIHKAAGYHVTEILLALRNLAFDQRIPEWIVALNGMTLMKLLLEVGDANEIECTISLVDACITHQTKNKVASVPGLRAKLEKLKMSNHPGIQQRAATTLSKLPEPVRFLKLRPFTAAEHFFRQNEDVCFCTTCHQKRGDYSHFTRGDPPTTYALPIGWARFGLSSSEGRIKALDCENKWHCAFHGTTPGALESILQVGDLVKPGAVVLGGDRINIRPGHFTENHKPLGFDTNRIFLSPSIKYVESKAYASPKRWKDDNTTYNVQVALEVFINPHSYLVSSQTITQKNERVLDPLFSNNQLEWSTNQQGSIIIYGLLIKMEVAPTSEVDSAELAGGDLAWLMMHAAIMSAAVSAAGTALARYDTDYEDDGGDDDDDSL